MGEAEKRNRQDSAYFVYVEDIRSLRGNAAQPPRQASWITYEVTFLEGETYHRPVARDGKPLRPEQCQFEDERFQQVSEYRRSTPLEERRRRYFAAEENRYRIDSAIAIEHHEAQLLGADKVNGRDVWVVAAQPRRGTPKPKRRSEWSLCQKLKYWIDQETHLPVRIEAEQLYDYDGTRKGAISSVETVNVEGVLLPERITSTTRSKSGRAQTSVIIEQKYSAYKRFRTETVLLFGDPSLSSRF
jgi:hypothetical protein